MQKVLKTISEADAIQELMSQMHSFKKHWFILQHQSKAFRESKQNVKADECIVHVDFSENFNCRYHQEIQAVHFGGSHEQASLHTVVLYTANQPPISYCSVSSNFEHGPIGIWAHLKPILDFIREQYPAVHHLTFWSDGPSSQYKQKGNFYRLCKDPFLAGFTTVSWNYFESSHGKGAVDGVGATVKRVADTCVRNGIDINTPLKLFDIVGCRLQSVKLCYINEEMFHQSAEMMPASIPSLKGTRDVHQVNTEKTGYIMHRKLSCFCQWQSSNKSCSCYNPKTFNYPEVLKAVEGAPAETNLESETPSNRKPARKTQKVSTSKKKVQPKAKCRKDNKRPPVLKRKKQQEKPGNEVTLFGYKITVCFYCMLLSTQLWL